MSLKAFHLLFVAISAIFGIGFSLWLVRDYQRSEATESLFWGVGSFAATVVLVVYARWFLRKLKVVGFL